MGHYDDDYAYDREQERKRVKKAGAASIEKIKKLRNELPSETPERFKDSLEDLENWLTINTGQ